MYNTPPGDDEHGQPDNVPQRRRREVVHPRQPAMEHHPDEHPEIPRILRASRFLEQETSQIPDTPVGNEATDEREQEPTTTAHPRAPETTFSTAHF